MRRYRPADAGRTILSVCSAALTSFAVGLDDTPIIFPAPTFDSVRQASFQILTGMAAEGISNYPIIAIISK